MPLTHPSGRVDAQKSSWMETLGPSAHISSRNSFLHYRSCPTEAMALNHPGSVGSGLERSRGYPTYSQSRGALLPVSALKYPPRGTIPKVTESFTQSDSPCITPIGNTPPANKNSQSKKTSMSNKPQRCTFRSILPQELSPMS